MFFVDEGGAGREGVVDAEDAGQGVDVDPDEGEGLLQDGPVFGHHQGDGVAAVPDLVGRTGPAGPCGRSPAGWSRGRLRPVRTATTPGKLFRFGRIDAADPAVGDARPPDAGPEQIFSVIVRGVFLRARYLGCGIRPGDGSSDFRDKLFQDRLLTFTGDTSRSASFRSSSLNLGWARPMIASARSRVDFPFRLTTPYSVTR